MTRLPGPLEGGRRRGVALVAAAALAGAGAAGLAAWATRGVFAALHAGEAPPLPVLAALGLAGLGLAAARVAERACAERVGQGYAAAMRAALLRHFAHRAPRELAGLRLGYLSIRFTGDLAALRTWASLGLARFVAAGVSLAAMLVLAGLIVPGLAVAVVLPVLAGLAVLGATGAGLGALHGEARARGAKLAAETTERARAAPYLRAMGRLPRELGKVAEGAEAMAEVAVRRARAVAATAAVPDVAAGLGAAAAVVQAVRTGASPADLAAALALLGLMLRPLRDLAGVADRYRAWEVAAGRCAEILAEPELRVGRRPKVRPEGPGRLEFREARAPGLGPLSAELRPGETVALFGPSGSGKSALLALAAGLEAPLSGRVRLDGAPPQDVAAREIVHVSAASPVLKGSLRRALTLGLRRRPADPEVMAAAEAFGLGALLSARGLDGTLGEDGRTLAPGERMRVLLVRAALAEPRLLLLDAPDADLDAEGIAALSALLARTGASVLIAPRRPAVLPRCDRVWRLEAGHLLPEEPPGAGILAFRPR